MWALIFLVTCSQTSAVVKLSKEKLEFYIRTYACLMRAIGMDVFRDRNDIFNESFLLRNIQIMVRVGNDLLTKKRFCLLQFGYEF